MQRLIAFDLDGTLVETRRIHRLAFRNAVREHAAGRFAYNDKAIDGLPTSKKLEAIGVTDTALAQRIYRCKQRLTLEYFETMLKPTPHIRDVIFYLWERYQLACYSNSLRATTQTVLAQVGLIRYFDHIVSAEDVSRPKPDPEGYDRLGPDLIVEDSDVGMAAAIASVGDRRVLRVSSPDEVTVENVESALRRSLEPDTREFVGVERQGLKMLEQQLKEKQ